MTQPLFDRDFEINVDGKLIAARAVDPKSGRSVEIDHLRVAFKVNRTLKKKPNAVTLILTNLSEDSRAKLQKLLVPVSIKAGYLDNTHEIFSGELTYGSSILDGTDWITRLQAGDGAKAFQSARISESLAGPAQVSDVMRKAAEALGVGTGNLDQKLQGLRSVFKQYTQGVALYGKAEKQFSKVLNPMGYDWSIQGGNLLILGPEEYIGTTAYVLSSNTGLLNSPEVGDNGLVQCKTLMIPDLSPGRPVKLDSKAVKGLFRIEEIEFVGDSGTSDWGSTLSLKPVG